jgi:hypothetical protein
MHLYQDASAPRKQEVRYALQSSEVAGAITPTNCKNRLLRSKQPTTILNRSKQSGEARRRIEAGPAQPIDRAVEADQSRRLVVADQRKIFDAKSDCL